MLSYMVPSEEKPPPGPLDLPLHARGQRTIRASASKGSAISADSSASSLCSVLQEGDRKKATPLNGQAKHPTLKRVSFGSSKGSMVETLIYESPLQEEPEPSPPASVDSSQGSESGKAAKVRVTFFECERPQTLSSPEPGEVVEALDAPFLMSQTESPAYQRQASTDSGWDNPFRPDGDLSREADEIVELIKGGKPITPTAANGEAPKVADSPVKEAASQQQQAQPAAAAPSPAKGQANGKAANGSAEPAQVDVKRATVTPTEVERVKLNKKPKRKCCVIQ